MGDIYDVVVVGAGSAGIAATRRLHSAGVRILALEARDRAGGRAWTRRIGAYNLDIGCEWLHSADESLLTPLVREAGFTVDESLPPWQSEADAQVFPPDRHAQFRQAQAELDERICEAGESGIDAPASTLLDRPCAWNGLLDAISTYVNGVELDRLSIRDVWRYRDTEVNFRIVEGMGAFFAAMAEGLPMVFGCPVHRIDHSGLSIRLETERGDISCKRVIVCVPTNAIAQERLRIFPCLPDRLDAAAHLPLGLANKVFLLVDKPHLLPQARFFFGHRDRAATGSYNICTLGQPVIEGYFGGRYARELEQAGAETFAETAISEICGVLGSDWRERLKPIATSAWASDPFALGAYSHALPGHADKRAILAAPHEERMFFAGEATAPQFFSTAHGAWESGLRAAEQALASLRQVA